MVTYIDNNSQSQRRAEKETSQRQAQKIFDLIYSQSNQVNNMETDAIF